MKSFAICLMLILVFSGCPGESRENSEVGVEVADSADAPSAARYATEDVGTLEEATYALLRTIHQSSWRQINVIARDYRSLHPRMADMDISFKPEGGGGVELYFSRLVMKGENRVPAIFRVTTLPEEKRLQVVGFTCTNPPEVVLRIGTYQETMRQKDYVLRESVPLQKLEEEYVPCPRG